MHFARMQHGTDDIFEVAAKSSNRVHFGGTMRG